MHAVDTSNLAYNGVVSAQTWERFKMDGWDMAIIGLHGGRTPNPHAEATLRNARAAGLFTAGYVVIKPGGAAWLVNQGREIAGGEWLYLQFVAIDVEWAITLSEEDVREGVEEVRRLGQKPIIYTYGYYWRELMGDPHGFSDIPLWDADYPGNGLAKNPTLGMVWPYGGWTKRAIHQYQNTHTRFGVPVDANLVDDALVNGGITMSSKDLKLTENEQKTIMTLRGYGIDGLTESELATIDLFKGLGVQGIARAWVDELVHLKENILKPTKRDVERIYDTALQALHRLGGGD
jgi:hypothetical protein